MNKDKTATFIGHSQCLDLNRILLKEKIIFLIENGIDTFISGGMGDFDRISAYEVYKMKEQYPYINNNLVIPYLNNKIYEKELFDEIIFPEGQEFCYYKAAITERNKFMINNSSYAICHVTHNWGGAAKTYRYAKNRNIIIIDI